MKAVAIYCVDGRLEDTRKRAREFVVSLGYDIPEGSLYGLTKAGPDAACTGKRGAINQESVYSDIELLIERGVDPSVIIFVAHAQCAGHAVSDAEHYTDAKQSAESLREKFNLPVVCLFDTKTEAGWVLEHVDTFEVK